MRGWLTGCCLILGLSPALATTPGTYALELLEQVSKANPDVLGATISAAAPKSTTVVVVASTEQHANGAVADPADIAAIHGHATTKVDAAGTRFEVRLPLHDVSGDTIGALRLTYAHHSEADVTAVSQ